MDNRSKLGPKEIARIADSVRLLQRRILADKAATVVAMDPSCATAKDARVFCFSKLVDVCNGTYLSLIWSGLIAGGAHRGFSALNSEGQPTEINWFEMLTNYNDMIKWTLLHGFFSSIDSSFRSFLVAIKPGACNDATAEFGSVAACLLKNLEGDFKGDLELVELLREVRNVVHTNGIYAPRSDRTRERGGRDLEYRGVIRKFVVGRPAPIGEWPLLLKLMDDTRALIARVVADQALMGVSHVIVDRSADSEMHDQAITQVNPSQPQR